MRLELRNTFASVCRVWRVAARIVYCEASFPVDTPNFVAALANGELAVTRWHGGVRVYSHDGVHRRDIPSVPEAVAGIAFDARSGHLFIADRRWSVHRYRVRSGIMDGAISNFDEMRCPEDLCLWQGVLFVADSGAHRIAAFDAASGEFLRFLGVEGDLVQPRAVAAHHERVFVVDSVKDHIVVFSWPSGERSTTIGCKGRAPGEFTCLRALAIIHRGACHYLLVTEERRIQLLTLSGVPCQVLVLGEQLRGACVSSERHCVFIAEAGRDRVHRLAFGDAMPWAPA
jgi:hypothetical protein